MSDETTAEFDSAELTRGWEDPDARPALHVRLSWAARTDIGRVRQHNEDKFDFFLPEDGAALARRGRLFAVADGMGGHKGGQIASEFALKTIVRSYFGPGPESVEEALKLALADANALVSKAAEQFGAKGDMGTTAVLIAVKEDMLSVAHVGDSRAYLLRAGERMRPLTRDHSWVEEQVRRSAMTREEAENSPYRNVITRSLGMGEGMEADVASERLYPGDLLLLASDGLTGYYDGDALAAIVAGKSPSQAALALIDAANDAGGKDNITALLVRVDAIEPWHEAATLDAAEASES